MERIGNSLVINILFIKIIVIIILLEHLFGINILFYNFRVNNQVDLKNKHQNIKNLINTEEELIGIQKYIDIIFNGTLIDKDKIFYPSDNPKISVIISVYNGEAYLKTALLSIQNQDFKDIEIIMVDDGSLDNSVSLIKELMIKEPRIVLYQNEKNRGNLYTKMKGINKSKGKYILLLDEDDIYVQRDAFSTLYYEAEKNNLDLIHFLLIFSKPKLENITYKKTNKKFPIIYQPELSEIMFKHTSS